MTIAVSVQKMSRVLLVMLALLAIVVLAACGSVLGEEEDPAKDPKLVALKQEKMATFKPPGGRLALKLELTDHYSLGKPILAQISRVFAYKNPARARSGWAAAVEAARASGWKLHVKRNVPTDLVFGGKTIATGGVTLTLAAYQDSKGGDHKVSIRLVHEPCGKGRCR